MVRLFAYKISLFLIFTLFLVLHLQAQDGSIIRAVADKNRILIGERIRLSLEADIPENEPIRFFQLDSLPHFEIVEAEKIDTVNTGRGTLLTQVVQLTSFDSGHWVIPRLYFGDSLFTDSIPVDVVFSEFNPEQPYHDVKDILDVEPEEEARSPWWYFAGGALLVLILLIYLMTRKKKPAPPPPVVTEVNPFEEAMKGLSDLEKQKPDSRQYYTIVVDVFRGYLRKKRGIDSLQKTTDDLVIQLKDTGLPADLFEKLSQSLRLSDFVKFAKYQPGDADDKEIMERIKQAILFIEKNP